MEIVMTRTCRYVRCGINAIRPVTIVARLVHPLHGHLRDRLRHSVYFQIKKYKFKPRNTKRLYDIPVFIISFNRLSYVKQTITWLKKYNFTNIHIIDNNSSYPPLLEYYKTCPATVHYMDKNYGHKVFWDCGKFKDVIKNSMYIVTDPDIEPNKNLPKDFIIDMYRVLGEHKNLTKVGFAIRKDDLPDTKIAKALQQYESRYWVHPVKDKKLELYCALTDTTFALYRPGKFDVYGYDFYYAIRIAGDFTCRHLPWYKDPNHQTTEDKYYTTTVDPNVASLVGLTQQLQKTEKNTK